jgi:hypothetical protein
MSELAILVERQTVMIERLSNKVDQLTLLVMKDKVDTTWVNEDTAAEMLGLQPRTIRLNVKSGSLPVKFRHTNGRNWQYSRKDIMKYKDKTSFDLC